MSKKIFVCILALSFLTALPAFADDYTLTIKNHTFSPTELTIPADQKVKITVKNADATSEEFESSDLDREKTVDGNSTITIFVGPLKAGRYTYFGDDHRDTAKGAIIVK